MLEICVDTIESVRAAVAGGADRIELCSALCDGGLTPTLGFLKVVKREFPTILTFVMLRPRGGSDFVYTDAEMDCLLDDLATFRRHGADGFVFGSLYADRRRPHVEQALRVIAAAGGETPVTFHRAFDLTDPAEMAANLATLQRVGFRRLLSSGLAASALDGAENLRHMVRLCGGDGEFIVMAGGGITTANAATVLRTTGCREFHGSGRRPMTGQCTQTTLVNGVDFGQTRHTDETTVRELVHIGRLINSQQQLPEQQRTE